jgi:orotate phosphoribosyltransferase
MDDQTVEALARRVGMAYPQGAIKLIPLGPERTARELANETPGLAARKGIHDFRDAAALTSEEGPVVLLVESGRTTRHELLRTVRLIEDAGGSVAGAFLVCHTKKELKRAWL